MRSFPTREALVRAYWQKLTSSIGVVYKSRGRVSAGRATLVLQTRRAGPVRSGIAEKERSI
jgi:hypothetical protein